MLVFMKWWLNRLREDLSHFYLRKSESQDMLCVRVRTIVNVPFCWIWILMPDCRLVFQMLNRHVSFELQLAMFQCFSHSFWMWMLDGPRLAVTYFTLCISTAQEQTTYIHCIHLFGLKVSEWSGRESPKRPIANGPFFLCPRCPIEKYILPTKQT